MHVLVAGLELEPAFRELRGDARQRIRRCVEAFAPYGAETGGLLYSLYPSSRDDVITCVMYREQLESLGLRFAPVEIAARFAFESATPEAPVLSDQFGMHELHVRRGARTSSWGPASAGP